MNFIGKSIYGSYKQDFAAILAPVLFCFCLAFLMNLFYPKMHPSWYFPLLMIIFDVPHIMCSFWVMFTSKDRPVDFRKVAMALLFFFTISYWLCARYHSFWAVMIFHAHFSAWHFIKQHQAWFYLGMGDIKPSKIGAFINKWGLHAGTYGFFFITLSGEEAQGWFEMNDLVLLPAFMRPIAEVVVFSLLGSYVIYHIGLAVKTKKIPVIPHMVWATGLIIYGMRLIEFSLLSGTLIVIPHAVSYLFLLQKYSKAHCRKIFNISPGKVIWIGYFIAVIYQFAYMHPLVIGGKFEFNIWLSTFTMAIGATHYLFDRTFWNSSKNPGWKTGVLGSQPLEEAIPLALKKAG